MSGFGDGICSIVCGCKLSACKKSVPIFLVVANQEREKLHLENPVAHDTQAAIKSAVDAIRLMIDDKGR